MRWLWVQFIYGLFISLFVSGYLIIYDPLFISGFRFASFGFWIGFL